MSIIRTLYKTVLDALFPISKAEEEVLSMDARTTFARLPRAKNFPIREATSIFSYKDELVWRLIWCIKYKRSLRASHIAAYSIFKTLTIYLQAASPIILIPMPISSRRRRERGFNQCELIIDELEKIVNKSNTKDIIIIRDLLLRTRHKSRQTLKDRHDRLENTHEIFAVDASVAIKIQDLIGRSTPNHLILIIDDVITTGSTILEAINLLRKNGLTQTFGLSVAH